MRLHDTLSGETSELVPRDPGRVSIYACGPTVYDEPHIGHARTALTYDVLRRYLRWTGLDVRLVANITDIDDNIINRAAEEETTEPELAARMEVVYVDLMRQLGIEDPDHRPHATEYVAQMHALIADLIDRDAAYVIEGSGVYFDVSAFPEYGALVHRTPDELREGAGARVEVDDQKQDPLDFVLWKAAKLGEPTWDSPWGPGRPGWHIECAAMALDLLGERFDVHGGGTDLAFPHHENERAEAEAAGHPFAGHWMHSAMLNISGEKMSKSLGNFETLRGALETYDPRALRLAFLQAHYRSVIELGPEAMAGAGGGVDRIDAFFRRLRGAGVDVDPGADLDVGAVERFRSTMDDDLGTPDAVAIVFDLVSAGNSALDSGDTATARSAASTARHLLDVLGIAEPGSAQAGDADEDGSIDELIAQRQAAREARDFDTADRIRDELQGLGIEVEDTASGPIWRRT